MNHSEFADWLLDQAKSEPRQLMFGPVLYLPGPNGERTQDWYFIVASGDADNEIQITRIDIDSDLDPREQRERIKGAVVAVQRPMLLHDFEDELEFARWCEAAW